LSERSLGVLVVDDEPGVRDLVSLCLRDAGFTVWPCRSGAEAVATYRDHQAEIDVVLLDVQMRSPDGPQILADLQLLNPTVRCVFMSGSTGRYDPQDLLDMGACRVLQKPFSLAALVEAIRAAAAG
jgi:CheY-like chemotaxis protein